MNRTECIDILRKNMNEQMLALLPCEVVEAIEYAVDFLEVRPERGTKKYFFTFGTDPQFPFGFEDYVEIHADTGEQAAQKFKAAFPCRPGSTLLNCAFVYSETQWRSIWANEYGCKRPAVVID